MSISIKSYYLRRTATPKIGREYANSYTTVIGIKWVLGAELSMQPGGKEKRYHGTWILIL
jgi:hypothetical protein